MCNTCGCNVTHANRHLIEAGGKLQATADGSQAVTVLSRLLAENDHQAEHNRAHFDAHGVLAVNLMSSPGAGKTSLLEATIETLRGEFAMAVIEGDLETENDAQRIRALGVEAVQITTGTACHLDAHMVHDALHRIDLAPLDIVFIENVGNLVCPASFDLGQHRNITLLSTPEGDDKPLKYPVMFRAADLVLVSKTDLLPLLDDFAIARVQRYLHELASPVPLIPMSGKTGDGVDSWIRWLRKQLQMHKARSPVQTSGSGSVPEHQHEIAGHHDPKTGSEM